MTPIVKALLWIGGGVAVGYLAWWLVVAFFEKPLDPKSIEYLSRIAADINRSVPVMIDKETELLPAQGEAGVLIYSYRLVGYSASQLNPQKFAAGVKEKVAQAACNRPETRDDFLKQGVTLRYSYFDKDRQHIATIDVTPGDCGF